jgi:small subunit ribosomal protein S14
MKHWVGFRITLMLKLSDKMKLKKDKVKFGKGSRHCRRCSKRKGLVRRYNLLYCRNCMREVAKEIGFKKYS